LNLLLAFAVSIKHYLRSEYGPNYSDLLPLIRHLPEFSGKEIDLPPFDNMPLELTYHISSFVAKKKAQDKIDVSTTTVMTNAISGMVDCLSQFERILRTPIPAAYSIHLKQTLVIYCLALVREMKKKKDYSFFWGYDVKYYQCLIHISLAFSFEEGKLTFITSFILFFLIHNFF